MSPGFDVARIIAVKDANFTGNLITASIAALVGYDYLLTIPRESRLFWKRKVNAATIIFFVNRYLALVYYVGLGYYRYLSLSYPDCRAQYYVDASMRYFQYLPWAVFSSLRVHALGQRNWFLSVFTFFWAVLAFPLDYYGDLHHTSFVNDPVLGCMPGASTTTALSLVGTIFIRGGQVIADVVVIAVTWKATHYAWSEGSMSFLTKVMFRHGTLYFIILLVLNILHIIFIFLPNSVLHTPFTNTSYVTRFSEPLSTSPSPSDTGPYAHVGFHLALQRFSYLGSSSISTTLTAQWRSMVAWPEFKSWHLISGDRAPKTLCLWKCRSGRSLPIRTTRPHRGVEDSPDRLRDAYCDITSSDE